ncbi:MAG: glycosyltransferase [Reyranella sp.]|uniref:glycosyltransferase n=1 Tax=Reyranella sp. TaxID=1929291 RepID=UPI003D0B49C9
MGVMVDVDRGRHAVAHTGDGHLIVRPTDFPYIPRIGPVAADTPRPFWSVMVPVYNCQPDYLRETLRSVLVQDCGTDDMQIDVIDNCSTTGDPEAVVREVGAGRITFHRQPRNVGMVENFNSCIRRSTGQWVHILHADDTVRPGFYRQLGEGVAAHPQAGAAFCRILFADEDSQWMGLSELEARTSGILGSDFAVRQFIDQRIQFPAIVVRRSTYEELGGFLSSLSHCVDWDMWKRIAVRKPIFYHPEPMACYRLHNATDSSRLMRTGRNVVEERRSIDLSCADFPPQQARRLRRAARKAAGVRAARRARQLWATGQHAAAWRQLAESVLCSRAAGVLARAMYFMLRIVVH